MKNTATQPIAVDGTLYFATGLSVVHAVDAASGKLLWRFDPKAAEKAGLNLRNGWGVRGISWWDGKIYVGTVDGRLIAIHAKRGTPVWSVQTFDKDCPAHINGAPRVFAGKVIVGFASEFGKTRGYVTTYDAETGRKLWRFYTVPGNPADGFESKAMEMAAKTWAGEWWKVGGGGDVWNAITYDAETDTVFLGIGNGSPMNRRVRSADKGDNLFVGSIVALEGKTGSYKWHYQTTPGDTWDYDATMDIELADLVIDGKPRKVLMQAPKNGFFYVIDRLTGQLISAEPYAKVTWASRIDLTTGRPVETRGARYPNGTTVEVWPSIIGAHNWMPMAYNPRTGLVYIPRIELGNKISDRNVDFKHWEHPTDRSYDFGAEFNLLRPKDGFTAALVAWNPLTHKAVWTIPHYNTIVHSGLLATGGGLVLQGSIDGILTAYSAGSGKLLWSYAAQAPLLATPISYTVHGEQYVTVLTGLGMSSIIDVSLEQPERYRLDARSQARRVLTFRLDAKAQLPPTEYKPLPYLEDPEFKPDMQSADAGQTLYLRHCWTCHGLPAVRHAPDLRRSGIVLSAEAFASVVRGGALVPRGMPQFGEFTDEQLANLQQYLRTEVRKLRDGTSAR